MSDDVLLNFGAVGVEAMLLTNVWVQIHSIRTRSLSLEYHRER